MELPRQKNSKLSSCTGCKTQCRSFDMTQCIGSNGHVEPYCSTACMNNHKAKYAKPPSQNAGIICHFCKRNSLPQYQATMPDGKLYNFCSSGCVAKFQAVSMQSTTNGQHVSGDIQLKCNYCKNVFSSKPETLEWENKVHQFCSTNCCDDYKKLHCIVTYCEYCQEEKTLHDTMKFSGVKKPFCSEGCKLLYKQDFARRLGLKCVTCNYCFQMCKRGPSKEYDGILRDFCGDDCSKKFQEWYYKAARCDCCKTQGTLKETVQWRGAVKNFCDQQCLLRFYNQQNEPNMATQRGPENMHYDQGSQTARTRIQGASLSASPAMTKDMKNKAVLCKPLSMTKATYCKPHMQTKTSQTEEDVNTKYVPVPIPVPVYVPVPVHLYSQNVPAPTFIPLPIPVPIFLPGSLKENEKFTEQLEELLSKSPVQLAESDMAMTTEPVKEEKAEGQDISLAKEDRVEEKAEEEDPKCCSSEVKTALPDIQYEPDLDIELDFPRAAEELDTENEFPLPPVLGEECEEQPKPRCFKKGKKRKAISDYQTSDDHSENSECIFPFKYSYGMNAWKHWLKTQNTSSDELSPTTEPSFTKSVKLKEELLQHSPSELSCLLARFVNEIRRPNGKIYAPDSIYYLCLGIQEFLSSCKRKDNIFFDPDYHAFGEEFNKIVRTWQPSILPDGSIFSRVEEEYLWRLDQLGTQSPMSLLFTLLYFNTKYFNLKTVEQHLRLSFGNVFRQQKSNPLTNESKACLQYQVSSLCESDSEDKITPGKRKHEDEEPVYEQLENTADSSRCPVKIFEYYLSKSPENLNQRMDIFYLKPESSALTDSTIWYSSSSLDRNTLENMLIRVLLVKDIYDENSNELDEDTD